MKKLLLHIAFLMVASGTALAQPLNLNNIIQTLCNQGDKALQENDFTSAEKLYTKACAYTDTLVLCVTKKEPAGKYTFKRSKLAAVFFAYEKLGSLYMTTGNSSLAEKLFNKSLAQRQVVFDKHSVYRIYPYALL